MPLLWLFVSSPVHSVLIDFVAGLFWGGFNLAAFTYQFDITPSDRRPRYLALFGTLVGIPLVFAPSVGGLIANQFSGFSLLFLDDLKMVFLVSAVLRFSSLLFLKGIDEPRVKRVSSKMVFTEIVSGKIASLGTVFENMVFLKSRSAVTVVSEKFQNTLLSELKRLKRMQERIALLISKGRISKARLPVLRKMDRTIDNEIFRLRAIQKRLLIFRGLKRQPIIAKKQVAEIAKALERERRVAQGIKTRLGGIRSGKNPRQER